jgi:probable HAF family extracellular repeat protein
MSLFLRSPGLSLLSLALLATTALAQPRYTLEDLGPVSGLALNASGEAVGAIVPPQQPQQAVRLQVGSPPQLLGFLVPGGWNSQANAINDGGEIVGTSATDTVGCCARGFHYTPATGMQPLPELPGTTGFSEANGINNPGKIVGFALVNGLRRPMIIEDGVARDLGTLGGLEGIAQAINDAGDSIGLSQPINSTDFHVTLWPQAGGVVDLQTLPGRGALVAAVTQAQQIIGELAGRAFLWTPSTGMMLLALLTDDVGSTARGINATGRIVGSGQPPLGPFPGTPMRAQLWEDGVPYDLNLQLDTPGWALIEARAINDAGQILAGCDPEGTALSVHGPTHTCLLTPVSLPTSPPVDRPDKPRRPGKEKKERLPQEEHGR